MHPACRQFIDQLRNTVRAMITTWASRKCNHVPSIVVALMFCFSSLNMQPHYVSSTTLSLACINILACSDTCGYTPFQTYVAELLPFRLCVAFHHRLCPTDGMAWQVYICLPPKHAPRWFGVGIRLLSEMKPHLYAVSTDSPALKAIRKPQLNHLPDWKTERFSSFISLCNRGARRGNVGPRKSTPCPRSFSRIVICGRSFS